MALALYILLRIRFINHKVVKQRAKIYNLMRLHKMNARRADETQKSRHQGLRFSAHHLIITQ